MTNSAASPSNGQRGLAAASDAQRHLFDHITQMNAENLRFLDQRIRHEFDTAKDLLACQSAQAVTDVCMSFCQTAMREYFEQFARLSGMLIETTGEAAADGERQIKETFEPEPQAAQTG